MLNSITTSCPAYRLYDRLLTGVDGRIARETRTPSSADIAVQGSC